MIFKMTRKAQQFLAGVISCLLFKCTSATFWTVTSYLEYQLSTELYDSYTRTATREVEPTAMLSSVTAVSTETSVISSEDLTIVYVYLNPGSVPESDLVPQGLITQADYFTETMYYEVLTYTAPSSCPKHFTFTTTTGVTVPSGAENKVTPTSYGTESNGPYTWILAYLPPGQVPITDTISSRFIARCTNPATVSFEDGGSSDSVDPANHIGDSSNNSLDSICPLCKTWKIYVIVVLSVIPACFLIGLFESYMWFRRLMRGKSCLRCVPISWVPITLWTLCFIRREDARPKEVQEALTRQWEMRSGSEKFRLWLRWGFRRKYPAQILGPINDTVYAYQAPVMATPTVIGKQMGANELGTQQTAHELGGQPRVYELDS